MKTAILFVLMMSFSSSVFAAKEFIALTDEQYENIDIIHAELKKKDSGFTGLNGPQEKMELLGISEKEARKVIAKIDFKKAREDKDTADPMKSARKSGRQKIQSVVSLTDAEFKALFGGE